MSDHPTRKRVRLQAPATTKSRACSDASPSSFRPVTFLCPRSHPRRHAKHQGVLQTVPGDRGEVCVPPHHLRALPAAKLLQCEQWRSALHVPACPGVPQVVPTEITDAGTLECAVPGLGADLSDRLPSEAEHVREMLAELLAHERNRFRIQRHRNRSSTTYRPVQFSGATSPEH